MKNSLAFICLVAIWSTTPLAIKWSAVDFAMSSLFIRMAVGVLACLVVLLVIDPNKRFPRAHFKLYFIVGFSIYLSMVFVYWASLSIPSGWIAVIWSLAPILTGVFAHFFTADEKLKSSQVIALLLSSFGIYWIFREASGNELVSTLGIVLCLLGAVVSSSSSVAIRGLSKNAGLSGLNITTGGLVVACPLFLLSALVVDQGIAAVQGQALYATIYLGLIGSCVGFVLYYYLLKAIPAAQVAMITLITPITALLLGNYLNGEPLNSRIWLGTALVICGILAYYYLPKSKSSFRKSKHDLPNT
jgi:drug/metabolite transporter (DMT)-like permease